MLRTTPEIQRFRASAALVDDLKALLDTPTLRRALEAVSSVAQPRSIPAPTMPGVHPDVIIAHTFCEMAGVNTALIYLRSLAFKNEESSPADEALTPEDEEEFAHGLPVALRDRP